MWPFVLWSGCLHCGWAVCIVLGLFRLCMGCFLGCSHCNLFLHCLPCAGWLMSFLGRLCHGWVVCTVLGLLLCLGAICAIHGVFALSVGHECHTQAVFIMLKLFSSIHVILELLVAVCGHFKRLFEFKNPFQSHQVFFKHFSGWTLLHLYFRL